MKRKPNTFRPKGYPAFPSKEILFYFTGFFFFYNKKGLNPKWKSPRAECGCTDNRIIFCSKESQTLALINRPVLIKRRKLQAQNYDLTRKGVKV